ncbi:MAG: haloalkane dehalogenase [Gaiellaceae bacterium]|nr:haloalkane dehalogenase [Gaiellaceae bacterium]
MEALADYPFAPNWLEIDGVRMHYVDEGEGAPVLLLHGEPTWSFLWRKIIPELPGRKIAPDLIGFGRSDKPEELSWYSYDRHVASVARLVEDLDLRDVTLVVHDWGGPIGLRVAVENDDRFARLVILNTGIGGGAPPSERWLRFREVVRELGSDIDLGRLIEAGTSQGLSEETRGVYDAQFPTPESKAGARAFPEMVPTEPDHPNAAPMNRVRDALRDWHKPALVVWGADDSVLPVGIAHGFVELLPEAQGPILLQGASHFLQEDKPQEVAEAIREFLRS